MVESFPAHSLYNVKEDREFPQSALPFYLRRYPLRLLVCVPETHQPGAKLGLELACCGGLKCTPHPPYPKVTHVLIPGNCECYMAKVGIADGIKLKDLAMGRLF